MPSSCSNDQQQHPRETGLAPYSEVLVWRRRFYVAITAALFAVVALAVICIGRQ
jgi:LPS O-antigen subunit length determinant protein (WzzB/FepE family)